MKRLFLLFIVNQLIRFCGSTIFHNQFGVHVPAGAAVAEQVAARNELVNIGQIGDLKNFFLFTSHHIQKRSASETSHLA